MSNSNRPKIKFEGVSTLLGSPSTESAVDIEVSKIKGFENHPFQVLFDEKMDVLIDSIRENGILNPVLIRPIEHDGQYEYEMLSGHRRLHAVKELEHTTIPAIVKEMDDDEAVITMVDSNIQREEILPSERAWALRMKLDAMRRQGKRNDLTSGNDCRKSTTSTEEVGKEFGLKERQVRNYIRLTYLVKELLEMVDNKRLQFMVAVELSYFENVYQYTIYNYIEKGNKLDTKQIKILRDYKDKNGRLSMEEIEIILDDKKPVKRVFTLKENTINKYFPDNYTSQQIEETIMMLIENWRRDNA